MVRLFGRVKGDVHGGENAEHGGLDEAHEQTEDIKGQRHQKGENPREGKEDSVVADHICRETKRQCHWSQKYAEDLDHAEEGGEEPTPTMCRGG